MDEENKTEKQPWQKPELIVLTRLAPEEAVLTYCKAGPAYGGKTGGLNNAGDGCGTTGCASPCNSNLRS